MRRTTTTTTSGKRPYAASTTTVVPYKRRAGPRRTMLPYQAAARVQAQTMGRPRGMNMALEVKSYDVTCTGAALQAVGAVAGAEPAAAFAGIVELNNITQGTTVAQRIGNKIIMKSLLLRTSIYAPNTYIGEVRCLVVYDRQPNGAFPALQDLLYNQPAGALTNYSSVNIANKSRFLILRDKFYNMDAAQSLVHQVQFYIKGRWETEYGASSGPPGVIGDQRTGALYFVAYVTYGGGVGAAAINNIQSRIRYYD